MFLLLGSGCISFLSSLCVSLLMYMLWDETGSVSNPAADASAYSLLLFGVASHGMFSVPFS